MFFSFSQEYGRVWLCNVLSNGYPRKIIPKGEASVLTQWKFVLLGYFITKFKTALKYWTVYT